MPKLISAPAISYKCSCGATSTAELEEFKERNTMPPTWVVQCAYCNCDVVCAPPALTQKFIGSMSQEEIEQYAANRIPQNKYFK